MPVLAYVHPQCCYTGWQSPSTSRLVPRFGFYSGYPGVMAQYEKAIWRSLMIVLPLAR